MTTVTEEHGKTFAEDFFHGASGSMVVDEAFAATNLMQWPEATLDNLAGRAAQARYHDIVDEIVEQTLRATKQAIARAFVRAASEVLARERSANDEPWLEPSPLER